MKIKINYLAVASISLSLLFAGCGNNSSSVNAPAANSKTDTKSNKETTTNQKTETNINGVYTGSQNISGLELTARLTISGSRWSATSQITGDSPEFQNGIVQGSDLYDDSGSIRIGYVSGNTARIDGYPSMSK
jgi:hypothetical protein